MTKRAKKKAGLNGVHKKATRKQTIGQLIKAARVKKKLKAEEVGDACNVVRSRVYKWEAAKYIKPKNHKNLSKVLGIPMKRLKEANASGPK